MNVLNITVPRRAPEKRVIKMDEQNMNVMVFRLNVPLCQTIKLRIDNIFFGKA